MAIPTRRSSSNLDEEGLELAVCRHGVLLSALNMYRGEIFAYPLYLQNQLASRQIKFFCMDVACKYWPYLEKVSEKCPELQHLLKMTPFLSTFHAKSHDFKCEVNKRLHVIVLLNHINSSWMSTSSVNCICCNIFPG